MLRCKLRFSSKIMKLIYDTTESLLNSNIRKLLRRKGQTNSKWFHHANVSSKKMNKQIQFYYLSTWFHFFLEESEDMKKTFWNYLTFSSAYYLRNSTVETRFDKDCSKTNVRENSNFHNFFMEVQNNPYTFLNLRLLY